MSDWMTTKEAADYVGTSEDNLAQLRHRGNGPRYSKPSHRMVRYRRADLDAWLEEHMVGRRAS